jgi:hypothetical protein
MTMHQAAPIRAHLARLLRVILLAGLCAAPVIANEAPTTVELDSDNGLGAKLQGYVSCINRHSNWTVQSRQRYYSWVKSPTSGPTGREPVVYGVYELRSPVECRRKFTAAAALPPAIPKLEQAAETWISALEHAVAVVAEANDYYALQNYKDDRMKAGKALHPRLAQAYGAFEAANDRFYAGVVEQQDVLAERQLQRLAADPAQRGNFLVAQALDRAKRLLRRAEGIGGKGFARDAFAAAVDEYERAWRELDAWRKDNPKEKVAGLRSPTFMHSAFELLKSAKSVMRREREGFRFSAGERMMIDSDAGEMIEGHPAHLVDKYNRFISDANW